MKKLTTIALGLFFIMGVTSCKKCIECKAEGSGAVTSVKQEYCGNKSERDQFKSSWMTTYSAGGYDNVSCD